MTKQFSSVIVRMPNWLGDAVMATPILQDIKEKWPDIHLTALCQGSVGHLLFGNPNVDEVFSFNSKEKPKVISWLKKKHFDLGVLLPNSFSSAWLFWRGGVQKRLGYASDGRSFFLTNPISFPQERGKEHLVTTYKRLLHSLNISLSNSSPSLYVSPKEKEAAEDLLSKYGLSKAKTWIGINPGAAYGSAKCWLPDRFRSVAEKLLEDSQIALLFFGDRASASLVQEICKDLPSRAVNLVEKTTLRELIALISMCDGFLTNDSGPMHIAAALRIPLVALFGSTNEIATGPYKHGKVIHKHVSCSPCYKRVCPIDFRCMKRIEVDEVYTVLTSLLN